MKINPEKRTDQQNRALHKYFRLLAEALNDSGASYTEFCEYLATKGLELPWTEESVKEAWRLVQVAMTQKHSTTELDTNEVNRIYLAFDNAMSNFSGGVSVEFPHDDES